MRNVCFPSKKRTLNLRCPKKISQPQMIESKGNILTLFLSKPSRLKRTKDHNFRRGKKSMLLMTLPSVKKQWCQSTKEANSCRKTKWSFQITLNPSSMTQIQSKLVDDADLLPNPEVMC